MVLRSTLIGVCLAAGLALLSAPPAHAQSLLDDLLPNQGTCTCAVMEPPNDCGAILAEPRSVARQQRGEIRAQCARDWRAACEEQYGWQACSGTEANQQLAAQCDEFAERWWNEIAAPQISQMAGQCDAANADWIRQCETVDRPQNCRTCEDMTAEIDTLRRDIAQARDWVTSMRNGGAVLTPNDEQAIAQRIDEIDRWQRDLNEKLEGFSLLQDSEFCPRV